MNRKPKCTSRLILGMFLSLCVAFAVLLARTAGPGVSVAQKQVVKPAVQKPVAPAGVMKTVRVIYPNGGETLISGKTYTIRWQSTGLQQVYIKLAWANVQSYMTTVAASAGSFQWKIPNEGNNDLIRSDLKVLISDPSGTPADKSDASFQIVLPAVDLECGFKGEKLNGNHLTVTFWIRNNGTRILNDVVFDWVIKRNGIMVSQDGAGFGKVFPDTRYDVDVGFSKSADEKWKSYSVDFFLDPENRQGEDEDLRKNNKYSYKITWGR
jgi:hypothetical protein